MKNIIDTAIEAGRFTTLTKALATAGLVDTLKGEGPYTVFAPSDDAFAKLPPGTVEGLLKDVSRLQEVLKCHVVSGKVDSEAVKKMKSAQSLQGQTLEIQTTPNIQVSGASVEKGDIQCTNGIIHVIDRVILPTMKKAA